MPFRPWDDLLSKQHVIAVDPGGRTGWASALMWEDQFELTGSGVLRQDQFARWLADQQSVAYLRTEKAKARRGFHRGYDVIVAESWRPRRDERGKMDWIEGDPLLSAQHLGAIRLIADLSGAKYKEYSPMQKPIWVASMPDNLKALDKLSSEQHDRDARMHLWGYFFSEWFTGEEDPADCVDL